MSKFFAGMKNSIKQKVGGLISNVKQQIQPDTKKNSKDTPTQHQQPQKQPPSQNSISPTSSVLSSTSTNISLTSHQSVSKKPFNIQLSEEDDKDLYNLNPGEDDDEEEEEGEEDKDEQICTDTKPKQPNVIPSNSITPQTSTITNTNTSSIPIDNTEPLSSTRSNNNSIYIEQKEDSLPNKAMKEDPNTFCHRIRKKNTLFSLDEVQYYSVHKLKEKESFLSSFGFVDSKVIKQEYIAFFEEGHLYFSKDIIIPNFNRKIRKVGNKYSLKDISNIFFEKDRSLMLMHLEFINNNNEFGYIQKDFYIHIEIVDKFINDLQQRLKLLGIECSTNEDDTQEESNQEEEQREEEPSNESPIKVQMPSEIQLMDK